MPPRPTDKSQGKGNISGINMIARILNEHRLSQDQLDKLRELCLNDPGVAIKIARGLFNRSATELIIDVRVIMRDNGIV